jgi:phospholipid/cholesterol/gamma-HCH transport system permease protein
MASSTHKNGLVRAFDEVGEFGVYAGRSAWALPGGPRYFSEVLRHASGMFSGTLLLLFAMCGFLGITVTNFAFFFLRTIGATDFIGGSRT